MVDGGSGLRAFFSCEEELEVESPLSDFIDLLRPFQYSTIGFTLSAAIIKTIEMAAETPNICLVRVLPNGRERKICLHSAFLTLDPTGQKTDSLVLKVSAPGLKGGLMSNQGNATKKKISKVALFSAVRSGDLDRARIILDEGMDIESEDYLGRRALHKAVSNNQLAMADMLLQRGVDVNAQGHQGYTPLTTACSTDDAEEDMVKLPLEHKVDTEL